jgi:hypothetical protein
VEHVQAAYDHCFYNLKNGKKGKQAGFPKFASKYKPSGNSYTTKFTNNNIELLTIDNLPYIKLPKVGKVRFVLPVSQTINSILPKNTRITSATIKQYAQKSKRKNRGLCVEYKNIWNADAVGAKYFVPVVRGEPQSYSFPTFECALLGAISLLKTGHGDAAKYAGKIL